MRLLRIKEDDLGKLAEANTQVRNVILVPCCHRGIEGIFIEYDAMIDPSNVFLVQHEVLADFDSKDVLDCTITVSDDGFTNVFTELPKV